uniref:Uncharacterized protein n=1 Tax=Panagrolaimus sp. ES5 TaxID=591445 RepID=A0AC34FET9_9BILA
MLNVLGDAEGRVVEDEPFQNEEFVNNRIKNNLKHMKLNIKIQLRRKAAEVFSNSVEAAASNLDAKLTLDISYGIFKTVKTDDDVIVLTHLFSLLRNLSESRSNLIHGLLPMGIVKLIANHARHSLFPAIRELAVQCLGEIANCCLTCKKFVTKTNAAVTIMEVLEDLDAITINQQIIYSQALRNIFHRKEDTEISVISVKSEEHMIYVLKKLISLPAPNVNAIVNGLSILREWVTHGGLDIAEIIANDNNLMLKLLQIFEEDADDDTSVLVIRIVGDLAYLNDALTKKIYDYGFVDAIEEKLINEGTAYDHDMIWCLSNILGMTEIPIVADIIKREELWDFLVTNCYNYCPRIRREALFCIINVLSFSEDQIKDEMYHDFFGRLIIDTLNGFTVENDLTMIHLIETLFIHISDNLKPESYHYRELVKNHGLQESVIKRYQWIQRAIVTFELTPATRKELYKLLGKCCDLMDLIEEFKLLPLPQPSTVPAPLSDVAATLSEIKTPTKNDKIISVEQGVESVPSNILDDVETFGNSNNNKNSSSLMDPMELD